MTPFQLVILILATWYIAYIVTQLDGPIGMFERLREFKGGRWHGRHGEPTYARWTDPEGVTHETSRLYDPNGLLDCIICTSVWVAFALLLLSGDNNLIDAFAVAGGAILIHGFTGWRHSMN